MLKHIHIYIYMVDGVCAMPKKHGANGGYQSVASTPMLNRYKLCASAMLCVCRLCMLHMFNVYFAFM